jgi:hypothetical protein
MLLPILHEPESRRWPFNTAASPMRGYIHIASFKTYCYTHKSDCWAGDRVPCEQAPTQAAVR